MIRVEMIIKKKYFVSFKAMILLPKLMGMLLDVKDVKKFKEDKFEKNNVGIGV